MNGEKKTQWLALKLAVVVLAGGGAAFFLLRSDPERKQSDAPETGVPYICHEDGHTFQVTPAKFDAMTKAGEVKVGGNQPGERGGVLTLRCPKCSKMTALRGEPCQKDGAIFPRRTADGKAGHCPKCGWSFYR